MDEHQTKSTSQTTYLSLNTTFKPTQMSKIIPLNFKQPQKLNHPPSQGPRELLNNRLLWQQMTQQYLDQRQRAFNTAPQSPPTTSYRSAFTTELTPNATTIDVEQFPLYGRQGEGAETRVARTNSFNGAIGISFWNYSDGRDTKATFRQWHPMTKPHGECLDEQFR